MKLTGPFISVLLVASAMSAHPSSAAVDTSDNVRLIEHFPYANAEDMYSGGSQIAFQGNNLYAAQIGPHGGIHVFDISKSKLHRLSFIPCPGDHTDVEVVGKGLIAVAFESGLCLPGAGVVLFDVSQPRRPRPLGRVSVPAHTITVYPGKPIIYVSGGGFARDGGSEYIIDASDPKRPEVTATFRPNPAGCHDLAFYVSDDEQLAACVGAGEGQVWDVSDPLAPRTIGHIPVLGQLPHSIAISSDGAYIAVGEESPVGECGGPGGALFIYDFAIREAPVLLSYYETPYDYPQGPISFCSPHFAFIPKTHNLVSAWGLGGVDVLDLTDPRNPTEIAHYVGTGDDMTYYWSAEYHRGRVWASDRTRGLDVLTVSDLQHQR